MQHLKPSLLVRLVACSPFVVMVTFVPTLSDPFNLPKLYVLVVLAVAGVVSFSFTRKDSFDTSYLNRISTFLYAVLLLIIFVSGTLSEPNFVRSLLGSLNRNNGTLYYCGVLVLSILCLKVCNYKFALTAITKYMLIAGICIVIYSSLQFLNLDPFEWNNSYNRIIGTFGNPNFSASALAIFSIVFLFYSWNKIQNDKGYSLQSASSLLLSVMAGFLSWMTDSLQGLIVILVGLSLFVLKLIRDKANNFVFLGLAGILVFSGIFSFVSFLGVGPLGDSLRQYTLNLRMYYASIGFKAMLNDPLMGVGSDRYLEAFLKLRDREFIADYGLTTVTDNAHSVPLHIGANFGILAFLISVAIMSLVNFYAIRGVLQKGTEKFEDRLISIFVILISLQSLISIEQIGLGAPLWILGAAVLGRQSKELGMSRDVKVVSGSESQNFSSFLNTEFVVILVVLLMLPFLYLSREDQAWKSIVYLKYSNVEDGTFIVNQFNRLSVLTLSEPKKAGRLLENLYNSGDLNTVHKLVEKLYAENPDDAYVHELFAAELVSQGNLRGAVEEYSKVLKLDPVNWKSWLKKGKLEIEIGDRAKAIKSLARVIELGPSSEEAKIASELVSNLNS